MKIYEAQTELQGNRQILRLDKICYLFHNPYKGMNGHCIVWEMKTNILSAKFLKSLNNYITFLCYFTNMPSSLTWLPLAKANPPPSNKTTPHGTIFSAAFHWRSGGRGLPFSERRNNIIALYFAFEIKCRRFWNSY